MMDSAQNSPQHHSIAFFLILVVSSVGLSIGIAVNPVAGFFFLVIGVLMAVVIKKYGFLHLVIIVFFLELILGGSGRLFEFDKFWSIRKVIFILVWILFLLLSAYNPQRAASWFRSSPFSRSASLLGVATLIFFGLGVGLFRGNRFDYIINDASGFTFLTISLPLGLFARTEKVKLEFIVGVVLRFTMVFGLIKGLVLMGVQIGYFNLRYLIDYLQNDVNQMVSAHATTGMARMATIGDVFLVFSIPLCLAIGVSTRRRQARAMALAGAGVIVWGLFASGSRGCWLASLIGVSVLFSLAKLRHRLKIFALILIGAVVVLQLFPETFQRTSELVELAFNRREQGNLIRKEQARILIDAGIEHPFIGYGFGHTLPNLVRSYEAPYSFELQYLAFFMKMGILGCAMWLAFFIWLLFNLQQLSQSIPDPVHAMIARGFCGGIVGVLAVSAANPYLSNAAGMGILALTVVIADLFRCQVEGARSEAAKIVSSASTVRFARAPRASTRQVSHPAKY